MKSQLTVLLAMMIGVLGWAQESLSLTLDEAIAYALENNRTAVNAARDIKAAKKQRWETTATGLPQINGSIEYQNFLKQPVSLLPASAFDNTESTVQTVEDFFGLTPIQEPDPVEGFIPVVFGTKQNVNAQATLSQLLFDGSYLVGLQSAKVFLEISENAKIKTDQEVRKLVIQAYGTVLLSEENVNILESNKATLQKNHDETKRIYENGLEEEESVEQLLITLTSTANSLSNAKRQRGIAHKLLNLSLGADVNTQVTLKDELEDLAQRNILLDLVAAEENIENNIDYRIAKNNERSQELLVKFEKSQALPSLSAFLNGGYQSFNDEFTFLDSGNEWFGTAVVGVNLNIPIFSSLQRSAKTQRAKIALEKAKAELTETEQQLKLQMATAKSDYQFAIESYETSKKNLALAERIEKKNQTKFFEGIGSSFELRQAQTQLYGAQQEYLQAMLNVITSKTELETLLNSDIN